MRWYQICKDGEIVSQVSRDIWYVTELLFHGLDENSKSYP